jgi:hypothetical protein
VFADVCLLLTQLLHKQLSRQYVQCLRSLRINSVGAVCQMAWHAVVQRARRHLHWAWKRYCGRIEQDV